MTEKQENVNRKFMNSAQAAELMGVSTRTLQRLRDKQLFKFYQCGRIIRYKASDLETFMENQAVEPVLIFR